jgi:hypothetical protein
MMTVTCVAVLFDHENKQEPVRIYHNAGAGSHESPTIAATRDATHSCASAANFDREGYLPDGWTCVPHADHLDEYWCPAHAGQRYGERPASRPAPAGTGAA